MTLFYILIAARLDRLLDMDYIRNAVCIGFIANELLSIVENAGLMGVPLPAMIRKVIDILKENAERRRRDMNGSEKLLELAKAQIGYQEKAGEVGLDDPDVIAGQSNYTKYSRDVDSWGLMGCRDSPRALPTSSGWRQRLLEQKRPWSISV